MHHVSIKNNKCSRQDSNLHSFYRIGFLNQGVCQFHHANILKPVNPVTIWDLSFFRRPHEPSLLLTDKRKVRDSNSRCRILYGTTNFQDWLLVHPDTFHIKQQMELYRIEPLRQRTIRLQLVLIHHIKVTPNKTLSRWDKNQTCKTN